MHIILLTNEYPPNVYGGAGVHVEYLTRELARLDDGGHTIQVLCFGEQQETTGNLSVQGIEPAYTPPAQDPRHGKFLDTMLRNVVMTGSVAKADIVHCHTWYSHLGGCLMKQLAGAKLVLTTHSLEPHRPWKVEQLGSAYHGSSWIEKTAYQNADGVVAVSESMKADVQALYGVASERIRVIPNGIDPAQYTPTPNDAVLKAHGIDPAKPYVLFVGRITRQKGIIHLVNALQYLDEGMQIVLAAGAPDTPEIEREMTQAVQQTQAATTHDLVWIRQMLPRQDAITLYSQAAVFACPSVYEPFGIINLEAMACETAVVASAVGGIPSVVVPNETGLLVPLKAKSAEDFDPQDPDAFSRDLATAINALMRDEARRTAMGKAGRKRVEEHFSWQAIAQQTLDFYASLLEN